MARERLKSARRVLVITGAGMSAESGVPTFRGPGDHWRGRHFTELANPMAFAKDPQLIWDWYLYRRGIVAQSQPNAGHYALAQWARSRLDVTLVTQNVDGLHEQAGHPDVIRFHGSLWHNRCTKCGKEREDRSLEYKRLPMSRCCRALERPAIVWFYESIPDKAYDAALTDVILAPVVLVIGTSGTVQPAAGLVDMARSFKQTIITINIAPDSFAPETDIELREPAAQALPRLLRF